MTTKPSVANQQGRLSRLRRRPSIAYGLALVMSVVALWSSHAIPDAHISPLFLFFYIAVLLAAWFGGLGPGLVAVLATSLESWYFIIPRINSFYPSEPGDLVRLITYVATATAAAMVVARLRALNFRTDALLAAEREARQATEEAERRNTSLLESIGDGFYSLDAEWRFTFLNRHAEELLGRSCKELTGRNIWDEFPEARGSIFEQTYKAVLQTQKAQSFETYYAPLGFWTEVRAYPKDDGGISVFFQDVSERHRLITELGKNAQRFERTFDLAGVGIAHVGMDGSWLRVNQRLCDIVGYSRPELLARSFQDLTHPEDLEKQTEQYERLKAGEVDRFSMEKRCLHKNGTVVWVNLTMSLMRAGGGEQYAIAVVEDISERKAAEERLLQLSAIVASSDDAIYGKTLQGVITTWNSGATKMYGYSAAEIVGRPVSVLMPADREDEMPSVLSRLAMGENIESYETVRRRKDGSLVDVSLNISTIRDKSGRIIGASTIARDITKQKQAKARLRESEERLQSIIENLAEGLVVVNADGCALHWNRMALQMHGYANHGNELVFLESLQDTYELATLDGKVIPFEEWPVRRMLRGEDVRDYELIVRNKKDRWEHIFSYSGVLVPATQEQPQIGLLTIRDVTERKRTEQALAESEQRFRELADNMSQFAWMADESGNIFWYNKRWFDYTGTTLKEMQGWGWEKVHHPDHVQRVVKKISRCFNTGEIWEDTFPLRGRDGRHRWFLSRAVPIRDESGRVLRWFGTNTDVTAQRNAEESLRERERELMEANGLAETSLAQLRATIDSMSEGVYVADESGEPLLFNPAFLRIFGFPQNSKPGNVRSLASLIEACDENGRALPLSEWPVMQVLRGESIRQREFRVRRKDSGKEMVLSHNATPVRDAGGRIIMSVMTVEDITALKQAEKALVRTEKLASVGRMAATIAHEINNPLETIMNAVYLAASHPSLPNEAGASLQIAEQELDRVAHITRQTLGFYRSLGKPTVLDVSETIASVLDIYGPRITSRQIVLKRSVQKGAEILATDGDMRQVISNLIANSIDAINGTGKLYLRSRIVTVPEDERRVRITVADTGGGIQREHLRLIFEPFFTTKADLGTGLGLWVTRELVQKNAGHIRVRSQKGRGTVFTLWFNAASSPEQRARLSSE